VREQLTPINLDWKVQMKKLSKDLKQQQTQIEDHSNFMKAVKETLDDLKLEAKFVISNLDKESGGY
jgi:hypothetical protein